MQKWIQLTSAQKLSACAKISPQLTQLYTIVGAYPVQQVTLNLMILWTHFLQVHKVIINREYRRSERSGVQTNMVECLNDMLLNFKGSYWDILKKGIDICEAYCSKLRLNKRERPLKYFPN